MSRNLRKTCFLLVFGLAAAALCASGAAAQTIDAARGADARVDYASLAEIGPWDDRNYALTLEDLEVLAPNEKELSDPIPAFFRVEMRKAWPSLRRSGKAQYPRSALNIFRQMFGGYQIDGKLYRKATRAGARFEIDLRDGIDAVEFEPGATRFLSGESRVTSPNGASESAVAIQPTNTDRVIAGTNGPNGGQRMHFSTDGGVTWTQRSLPLGGTCCDPAVDWSSDGTLAYTTTLGGCGFFGCSVWFYRSDDLGNSWTGLENITPGDPRREITGGGSDKEFLHVDKHPTSPFKDNIYVTWHDGNQMKFARSTDFGNTFATQAFSSAGDQLGIGSDITSDADGNVYYFWPAFVSQRILLRKSVDGGASFQPPIQVGTTQASFIFPLPSIETREAFVYVAADTDRTGGPFHNNVYAAWTDSTAPTGGNPANNHGRIQVARSTNGGATWSVTTPHSTADALTVDRWHPWIGVAGDGSVHVVFYDTRRDPSRSSVDLFHSFSTDGGVTFSAATRVTAEQSPNIGDSFEFGDYNGLDVVLGDLIAVYTDNRNESGGGADSVDIYAAGIPVSCSVDADCDDGNGCTTDACNQVTGQCEFTVIPNCLPTLTLTLNQSTFSSGETQNLTASVDPGLAPSPVDVYIWVELPNGSERYLVGGGNIVGTPTPIVSNWTPVTINNSQIFSRTFNGSEPLGTYTWRGGFADPGTMNFPGALEEVTFDVIP